MRLISLALCLGLLAASTSAAQAQERSPALRQSLVDLAYVLGESHALRQACSNRQDQHWRTRMIDLVATEQPDAALDRRLRESFNSGFATRQGQFPNCTAATRRAEAQTMARGRSLSERLAQIRAAAPDNVAEDPRVR
jgi:uncharacterized protein (TIGR02301 family)